jgi:hypothetical protein
LDAFISGAQKIGIQAALLKGWAPMRSMIEPQIRAAQSMVEIELNDIQEFFRESEHFFESRVKKFKADISHERSKLPYREDEEMSLADRRMELEGHLDLNRSFGLVMVFSSLERFFSRIYMCTMELAARPELQEIVAWASRRKFLVFADVRSFIKAIDVNVSDKRFRWGDVEKLQHLRNAIVHQGGLVTAENLNNLRPYGYKEGQTVVIASAYVEESIELVQEVSQEIAHASVAFFERKGFA